MLLILWLQAVVALTAVILLLAWVITGRRKQILLRLVGVCSIIMAILLFLRAGR